MFACLDAGAKYASRSVPVMEVVFARYAGAMVVALVQPSVIVQVRVMVCKHGPLLTTTSFGVIRKPQQDEVTMGGSKSQLFKARAKLRKLLAPLVDLPRLANVNLTVNINATPLP